MEGGGAKRDFPIVILNSEQLTAQYSNINPNVERLNKSCTLVFSGDVCYCTVHIFSYISTSVVFVPKNLTYYI